MEGKGRLGGSPRCAKSSDCAAAGSGKVRSVRYLAQGECSVWVTLTYPPRQASSTHIPA